MAASATEQTITGSTTSTLDQPLTVDSSKEKEGAVAPPELDAVDAQPPVDAAEQHGAAPEMTSLRAGWLVFFLAVTMTLNIMQIQSVTIQIESIGKDLNVPTSELQWLASAFSLSFGALLLLFGRLADIFGHKLVFLVGMAWFVVWTIAIALSPNEIAIFLFRAFQGAGMGAAIPSALGIIGTTLPGKAKTWAFALFSAGAPLGGSIGGVLGGVFSQYSSWRYVYYLSAGLGALIAAGVYFTVPGPLFRKSHDTRVDWTGAALITSGLVLFTFALADGSGAPNGWKTPYIPATFSIGVVLMVVFWFWELHLERRTDLPPLMKPSLFSRPKFAWVMLIGASGWSAFSSYMLFASQYYQDYLGLSQIHTVLRFLPSAITGLLLNVIVGLLADRVPAQILIILGGVGTALAPLLLAVQNVNDPYWQWGFPSMILTVFGADFIFSCGIMYVSKVAGPGQQGLAGGVFNVFTQVGTSFGLAIQTIIQSKIVQKEVEKAGLVYDVNSTTNPPDATLAGLRGAFWGCTGFAIFATLIACSTLFGIGKVGHKGHAPPPAKAQEEVVAEKV